MKFWIWLIICVVNLQVEQAVADNQLLSCEVLSSINNDDGKVTLDEVVRIPEQQSVIKTRLQRIVILDGVLPSRKAKIPVARVYRLLQGHCKVGRIPAQYITVLEMGQSIEADQYVAHAAQHIENKLQTSSVDTEFSIVGSYRQLQLPTGSLRLEVQSPHEFSAGRNVLWVSFYVDSRKVKNIPVWYQLTIRMPGLKTKQNLSAGHILTADDVVPGNWPCHRCELKGRALAELSGYRLLKNVRAGAVLQLDDVELIPPVFKGQRVKVVAEQGAIRVSRMAVAQSDGDINSRVVLKNDASGEAYSGIVVSPGLVRVAR